jgi:hypothetical protein
MVIFQQIQNALSQSIVRLKPTVNVTIKVKNTMLNFLVQLHEGLISATTQRNQMITEYTDADKAKVLDWLLQPVQLSEYRGVKISREVDKSDTQSLLVFRAWCDPDVAMQALFKASSKS